MGWIWWIVNYINDRNDGWLDQGGPDDGKTGPRG